RIVPELGLTYDIPLATALLTGIVRDSHGFSGSATSGATLRIAADLVDAGASLSRIHRDSLAHLSWTTMALWGRMLQRIGQRLDGRVVYTLLTEEMLGETGARQDDADGIVEFIATARDASIALLCREIGPRETRISIRTADSVDATAIASAFGGGGHSRRAGCTIQEPLDVAIDLVLREAAANLPADVR
ncbi:MAG TPA: DHHA1 domain-containing protein, partial [Thermomicrobiales bacterium]|nr:DHHA1 domain-containing protein [Thermomicrobiales bacterium]